MKAFFLIDGVLHSVDKDQWVYRFWPDSSADPLGFQLTNEVVTCNFNETMDHLILPIYGLFRSEEIPYVVYESKYVSLNPNNKDYTISSTSYSFEGARKFYRFEKDMPAVGDFVYVELLSFIEAMKLWGNMDELLTL